MAGDWIKFECATPDKPEVWAISAALDIDPDAVVGKLLRVWGWFDQQTEDGTANKASKNMLDRLVGCIGFCDAVCGVGWMVIGDDSISLPDFDKHNGKTAKNRINTAKRVAAYKGRQKSNAEGNDKVTEKVAELTDRQAMPRPIRALIFQRDKSTCVYCGRVDGEYCPPETKRDAIMSVDHVIPLSRKGSENIDNLVCACMSCNNFKNDRTPEEAGLEWPVDEDGKRYGSVTSPLPKEEKRREDIKKNTSGKPLVTFSSWINSLKDLNESAIEENDPIFEYASEAGIPSDYLRITWVEFKAEFMAKDKKQKDWRAHFRNFVRKNFYALWWIDNGEYKLTTRGQQAMTAMNNKKGE